MSSHHVAACVVRAGAHAPWGRRNILNVVFGVPQSRGDTEQCYAGDEGGCGENPEVVEAEEDHAASQTARPAASRRCATACASVRPAVPQGQVDVPKQATRLLVGTRHTRNQSDIDLSLIHI